MKKYYLAIDIGASSGRHMLACIEDGKLVLEEIYRFKNQFVKRNGHFCWDTVELFDNIKNGIKKCKEIGKIPESIGIDTWGVDFVLLDKDENIVGDTVAYRDGRTATIQAEIEKIISTDDLYARTGIQPQVFNTIYQLYSIKETLDKAENMLFMPEYFNYLLTGVKKNEYTNASTSGLLSVETNSWDYELIDTLGYPRKLFKELSMPGTVVGEFSKEIAEEIGFVSKVVLPCTHDTGSAVLAVPEEEGAIYISSGTWSLMGVESRTANTSVESRQAGMTNEGGYDHRYRYLKNIMGLWMIQSVKKELDSKYSFDELCNMAEECTDFESVVDVNDNSFLAPDSMIDAVKEYCDKTGQKVPESIGEVVQCIYVSLAKSYGQTAKEIEKLTGKTYDNICIVGGGSKDTYLNKLTGIYTGKNIITGPTEATAIGNLMVQTILSGEVASIEDGKKVINKSFNIERL